MNKNREYRSAEGFAAAEAAETLELRGTPIVFDTPTCLFECEGIKYFEIIASGALDNCDMSDFIFNYNHSGRVYARNRNKSLEYILTSSSFEVLAHLRANDAGHKQFYDDIQSGLIDKMSFSFVPSEEKYDRDTRTRTITKIKKLYDVAAVDFPAYNDTNIAARSFFNAEREKEAKLAELAARKRLIALTYY